MEAASIRQLIHSPRRLHQCLRRRPRLVLPGHRITCLKVHTVHDKKIKLMLNVNPTIALRRMTMRNSKFAMAKDNELHLFCMKINMVMNISQKIEVRVRSPGHL